MNLKQATDSEKLESILAKYDALKEENLLLRADETFEREVGASIEYLGSQAAADSMAIDPYWPKWHSPWWHITLLYEIGLAMRIPESARTMLSDALQNHYIHIFPARAEEVPEGCDPVADIICHCALGTAHRVLIAAGMRLDESFDWMRSWFLRYQLKDGGFNCDESAYALSTGKSSMVSTVHIIESLLDVWEDGLSSAETGCLDRAVDYLVERKLLRSLSKNNKIINDDWAHLTFPRFYEYDILRGLSCVLRWATLRNASIRYSSIDEAVDLIDAAFSMQEGLASRRSFYAGCMTRTRNPDGSWGERQAASTFSLLVATSAPGRYSPWLTRQWLDAIARLGSLKSEAQLIFSSDSRT